MENNLKSQSFFDFSVTWTELFKIYCEVFQREVMNHTIGWDNSKIITTNQCYHQRLCLEAWHINSAHTTLNRDDGGLLPYSYLHLVRKKAANQ